MMRMEAQFTNMFGILLEQKTITSGSVSTPPPGNMNFGLLPQPTSTSLPIPDMNAPEAQSIDDLASHFQSMVLQKPSLHREVCDVGFSSDPDSFQTVAYTQQGLRSSHNGRTCECWKQTKRRTWRYWAVTHTSTTTTNHLQDCPYYFAPTKTETIQIQVPWIKRLVSYSLSLSMSISGGSGGLAIAPLLTFRPIVPYDSGAFRLLTYVAHVGASPTSALSWKSTLFEILKLYRAGKASPFDRDENGKTILMVSRSIPSLNIFNPSC